MKQLIVIPCIIFLCALCGGGVRAFAQETSEQDTTPSAPQPVKKTFDNAVLIDNQTVKNFNKNSLGFVIQHRFGIIENSDDLYGIFAPANIRLGLNYGITSRLSAGLGVTKNKRLYDLQWKYSILNQTKPAGMPVSVAYFGNIYRSALPKSSFVNQDSSYVASNRFTYFHQLMIAKKFNDHLSLQVAGSFSHLNLVDTLQKNDIMGVSFIGRYKFSKQSSVQFEFDYPITLHSDNPQKPNLGIGYEVSTGGHQFQIFICTADAISYPEIMAFNRNDFTKKQILLGFNISRMWDL